MGPDPNGTFFEKECHWGQTPLAPFYSECDGAESHATGGGQGRDEGRECSYYHLRYKLNYSILVHVLSRYQSGY